MADPPERIGPSPLRCPPKSSPAAAAQIVAVTKLSSPCETDSTQLYEIDLTKPLLSDAYMGRRMSKIIGRAERMTPNIPHVANFSIITIIEIEASPNMRHLSLISIFLCSNQKKTPARVTSTRVRSPPRRFLPALPDSSYTTHTATQTQHRNTHRQKRTRTGCFHGRTLSPD